MTNRDVKLNQILDNFIENWIPVLYRLMKVAFFVLAFMGVVMATMDFTLAWGKPLYFSWSSVFRQAGYAAFWPLTVAPLWWKLSFFIMGGLVLFPRLLTIRD